MGFVASACGCLMLYILSRQVTLAVPISVLWIKCFVSFVEVLNLNPIDFNILSQ
jgi:hypothetical protein